MLVLSEGRLARAWSLTLGMGRKEGRKQQSKGGKKSKDNLGGTTAVSTAASGPVSLPKPSYPLIPAKAPFPSSHLLS